MLPTWRSSLVGPAASKGAFRLPLSEDIFLASRYAVEWGGLLRDPRLLALAREHALKITFCLHAAMAPYVPALRLPPEISTTSLLDLPQFHPLLAASAMLLTDHSSVAFEAAVLDMPVAYFQFDREEFFVNGHSYDKGYFDYETDGFGPVCLDREAILEAIGSALAGKEDPRFSERRRNTIAFRDGHNCERVHDALLRLLGEPAGPS